MIGLLEKGGPDGRRETDHEILCAVSQTKLSTGQAVPSTALHNCLHPTIDGNYRRPLVPELSAYDESGGAVDFTLLGR